MASSGGGVLLVQSPAARVWEASWTLCWARARAASDLAARLLGLIQLLVVVVGLPGVAAKAGAMGKVGSPRRGLVLIQLLAKAGSPRHFWIAVSAFVSLQRQLGALVSAAVSLQRQLGPLVLGPLVFGPLEDFAMLGPLVLGACHRRWKKLLLRGWQRLIQLARPQLILSHPSHPGGPREPIVGAFRSNRAHEH